MAERFQLHISSIEHAVECGEWFRMRYVEGVRSSDKPVWIMGNAVDRAVQHALNCKLNGNSCRPDELVDLAMSTVDDGFKDSSKLSLGKTEIQRGLDKVKFDCKRKAGDMVVAFYERLAPFIKPKYIQKSFSIRLDGLLADRGLQAEVDLVGSADIIEEDGTIRDIKAGDTDPENDRADRSLQLTGYALGSLVTFGEPIPAVALDHLIWRARGVRIKHLRSSRTLPDIGSFLDGLVLLLTDVYYNQLSPTPSWKCVMCEYAQSCIYSNARRDDNGARIGPTGDNSLASIGAAGNPDRVN